MLVKSYSKPQSVSVEKVQRIEWVGLGRVVMATVAVVVVVVVL